MNALLDALGRILLEREQVLRALAADRLRPIDELCDIHEQSAGQGGNTAGRGTQPAENRILALADSPKLVQPRLELLRRHLRRLLTLVFTFRLPASAGDVQFLHQLVKA